MKIRPMGMLSVGALREMELTPQRLRMTSLGRSLALCQPGLLKPSRGFGKSRSKRELKFSFGRW
ncbi:hypothetical protein V2J09_014858 [Rumex salicifolius]